jgi:hypothetical protein
MDRRTRDGAVGRQWRLRHCQKSHLTSPRGGSRQHSMLLQTREVGGGKTYGRLHGAHRHRRNRPCTYPNYQSSAHVQIILMPIALLRRVFGGAATACSWAMRATPLQQGWPELWFGGELTHCR